VLAGPTAVGKGTVAEAIRQDHPEIWISVSATTRPPRPGEVNGVHYWFVSDDEFDAMVKAGDLLEWAVVAPGRPLRHAAQAGGAGLADGETGPAGDRPPGAAPGSGDDARRRSSCC
jgi:guanylate kinase